MHALAENSNTREKAASLFVRWTNRGMMGMMCMAQCSTADSHVERAPIRSTLSHHHPHCPVALTCESLHRARSAAHAPRSTTLHSTAPYLCSAVMHGAGLPTAMAALFCSSTEPAPGTEPPAKIATCMVPAPPILPPCNCCHVLLVVSPDVPGSRSATWPVHKGGRLLPVGSAPDDCSAHWTFWARIRFLEFATCSVRERPCIPAIDYPQGSLRHSWGLSRSTSLPQGWNETFTLKWTSLGPAPATGSNCSSPALL